MSGTVDIEFGHAEIVRAALLSVLRPGDRVFVFGSRATGHARRTSDLDLAVDGGRVLSLDELGRLTDEFEEAPVPWSVDVIDLRSVTPEFYARIADELVPFLTVP